MSTNALPDESFFRDICLHSGMALIAADADLRIRFWNAAAGRVFGGSAETMLGESVTSIVPGERREHARRLIDRTLERGEVSEFEFQHRDPSGRPTFLAVTISPVIDHEQRRLGVSIFVRDVTRRMELVQEAGEATKMSALGSMVGAVAHHFNNLLGALITASDFAQQSDDPDVLRKALRTVISTLTRGSELTNSLLAFAEGDRRTTCSRDDLVGTIQQFIATIQTRLDAQNVRVEADLEPVRFSVPASRMLTVLDSLTVNALEAMPDGGTLRFELRGEADKRDVLLRVSDTGTGIAERDLAHVFEPFFTTKSEDGGGPSEHAGLGLAVVHGIIKELGGTVTLSVAENRGTACTIRLPMSCPT